MRTSRATQLLGSILLLLSLPVWVTTTALAQGKKPDHEKFAHEIDAKIHQLLVDFSVPGAALAIIEDGKVVFQKAYGFADLREGSEITPRTGFNVGSISKTVAAWGVMKLVHEGKLELDAPAEKYLSRWRLPESEFDSREVTIRRLLSHTAGLSLHSVSAGPPYDDLPSLEDWLVGKNDGLGPVEMILEPGTQYKYSGGGFGVLQLIVEEVTGQSFEDYMQSQILDPLGMRASSYEIDGEILAASATPYDTFGEETEFERFTVQAGAGLHTTLEDFTRFALANLYRLEGKPGEKAEPVLPPKVIEQMMVPVLATDGRFLRGLGYLTTHMGSRVFAGHGGSNEGWQANFAVDPGSNDGFVVLTNSGGGGSICNLVFYDWITWKSGESPWGGGGRQKPTISIRLKQIIDEAGIENVAKAYARLKKDRPEDYDFSEGHLNELGYYYLGKGELDKAIAVLKTNADAFPCSFNVHDSYGEALLARGAKQEGIEAYKQSVRLNPSNDNGIRVLKELGESTDDLLFRVPAEHLKRLEAEYVGTHDAGWRISVKVDQGVLKCVDRYYDFTLVPIGNDRFVNPRFGALWRFDAADPEKDPVLLFGQRRFTKER